MASTEGDPQLPPATRGGSSATASPEGDSTDGGLSTDGNAESSGTPPGAASNWEERAGAPGVLMATRFDTEGEVTDWMVGTNQDHVSWDVDGAASGAGCLRMDVLAGDSASSGEWVRWLADDQREFTTGDTFYVSFRQYFPLYYTQHRFSGGGGWKQNIVSRHASTMAGVPQNPPSGSNQLYELVLVNGSYRSLPQGYNRNKAGQYRGWDEASANGCSSSDFRLQAVVDRGGPADDCAQVWARYGGLYSYYSQQGAPDGRPNPSGGEFPYYADEWLTFKIRVGVGTFETSGDEAEWAFDTLLQVWVARDGDAEWTLVHDKDPAVGNGISIGDDEGGAFDALWLLPYDTGKQPDPTREDTYTLYDEVLVSEQDIATPQAAK